MKIPAKQLLVEHANEGFVPSSTRAHVTAHLARKHANALFVHALELMPGAEEMARARNYIPGHAGVLEHIETAIAAGVGDAPLAPAFTPGPPRHVQPGAHTLTREQERIRERSIAGDDESTAKKWGGRRSFLAALWESDAWGPGVRSSTDPDRFGKRGGGSGRAHDPHVGREAFYMAVRGLRRFAESMAVEHDPFGEPVTGAMWFLFWKMCRGGARSDRNLYQQQVDDYARAISELPKKRAAYHERVAVREKRLAEGMSPRSLETPMWPGDPTPPPKSVLVPKLDSSTQPDAVLYFREQHGVRIGRRRARDVIAAFDTELDRLNERAGWYAGQAPEADDEGEEQMATGDYVDGWGEIAKYLKISVRSAQKLEARGLPVRKGLTGGVSAKRSELDEFQDRARALRSTVWSETTPPVGPAETLVRTTQAKRSA